MQIQVQGILEKTTVFVNAVHKPVLEAREAKKGNTSTFNNFSFAMAHTAIEDHNELDLLTQRQVANHANSVFAAHSNLAKSITPFLTFPARDLRQILTAVKNNSEIFNDLPPDVAGGFADILELFSTSVSNSILGNIKPQEVQQFQALNQLRSEFALSSVASFFRDLASKK
ncbi:MAG: hypothetical protein HY094_10135 [Candidatus Melainabacteria bacterium]|nr:hypothetical protein [Candidatus Melainabacteria bacterium]